MTEPVAIVGAAGRFPGAKDLEAYWDLLICGRDAVTEIPDSRWSKAMFRHPDPGHTGRTYTWSAGVIPELGAFDPAFFGISPREAGQIDPQQRLLLELVWEAMEDAGMPPSRLAGSGTGVFVGASGTEYGNLAMEDPAAANAYFMTGTTTGVAANRISYVFDLRGPSFIVDTACSSSLVALHQACQAIRSGEVPMAVAGGVNVLLTPFPFAGFSAANMLSPDGRCFAFDARANGYVRAEGGGVVLLKPLSAALADGDAVRAVIRGTGLNSDGRTMGLSLPNGEAQARLLRQVYDRFEIEAEDLGFMEAHGTGTQAGDPIELWALGQELGKRRSRPLPIGSAKTNVGHLEVAAGMAGLLKSVLALEHRTAPPSRNFETPNPNIDFDDLNLEVLTAPTPLGPDRLTAGVNAFGFGGTNAHAVVSAAPERPRPARPAAAEGALPPLLISARSEASLQALAEAWAERLEHAPPEAAARDIRAAARRRDHHRHRACAWGATPGDLATALRAPNVEHLRAGWVGGKAASGRTAFVFTGNGAQFAGMARDALAGSAVFRAAVAEVDAELAPRLGWSPAARLAAEEPAEALARTDVAQPLLFTVQVAIVRALEAAGARPDMVAGHSVGEIAAAWAAGALSLADAARVVVARSRQQQRTAGMGRMAALALGRDAALDAIAAVDSRLELAAENSSGAVTVAGPADAIARLGEAAQAEGWRCTTLQLDYAFHSAAMDPVQADLLSDLAGLQPGPTDAPFVSAVLGEEAPGEALGADYWWRNIRERVRFQEATDRLIADGARVLVEIGPHAILQSYMRDALKTADVEGRVLATLTRRPTPRDPFPAIAARLYAAGADLAGARLYDGPATQRGLPSYPWTRERPWFGWTSARRPLMHFENNGPLLGFRVGVHARAWIHDLDPRLQPWLADHALEGAPLLPAAAMAEVALAAARTLAPTAEVLEVSDLEILRALPLEAGRPRELRVRLGEDRRVTIESRQRLSEEGWGLHAVARAGEGAGPSALPAPAGPVQSRIGGEDVYAAAARLGLDYGPCFRPVAEVEVEGPDAARVLFAADAPVTPGQVASVELMDGAFHGFLALLLAGGRGADGESLLPVRMGRVRVHAPFERRAVSARIAVTRRGVRSVRGEAWLLDAEGAVVAEMREVWFRRVRLRTVADPQDRIFRFDLVPAPLDDAPFALGTTELSPLVAREGDDVAAEASALLEAYLVAGAHEAVGGLIGQGPISADELRRELDADAAPLGFAALELLARHGLAQENGGLWTLAATHGFGERAAIWRTLLAEHPALSAELALAADAAADLPRLLREGPAGRRAPPALLEQMLHGSPAARAAEDALLEEVARVAAGRAAGWPLRVLELGAGAGAFSERLLRRLAPDHGPALQLVATDPDPDTAARLGAVLAGRPGVSAQAWSPQAEEPPGRFDAVVAAHALTRLRLDETGLAAVRRALAPGGVLLAAEPTPSPLWDLVLGRDPAWWSASSAPEFPLSPLRTAEGWAAALEPLGVDLATAAVPAAPWSATLLRARVAAEGVAAQGAPAAVAVAPAILAPDGDPLAEALERAALTAPPSEVGDVVWLAPSGADAERAAALAVRVRALTEADAPARRLWIVVRGAAERPSEAVLAGVARTLVNEHPELSPRLVDLAPELDDAAAAACLLREVSAPDGGETEVVWTGQGRFTPRLRRGAPATDAAPGAPRRLEAAQPGLLSSLRWSPAARRAPAAGEVAIDVRATGLNFRDVMWAQGLLPEEALLDGFAGPTLGLECAGVVSAVGPGVEGLAPGDRVMAFAPAALASEAVTAAHTVVKLPDEVSFTEGATVPVAFLTVAYALGEVARLRAGERVLIHGGAGGVGLAAIQWAQAKGAEVFATAGSHAKREVLRQLGVEHVLDSRSLAFAEEVRRITGGEGVDVVLNSLAGEAMERSLALLRPFGRFLELGKRDFFENTRVGLRPLRENVSYFAIDADRLPLARPELSAQLLAETMAMMRAGELRPLAFRAFDRADAEDAFRLMQAAGHIGKIVLTPDADAAPPPPARALMIRADRTYLVTGGLSGFGLATARWLATQGARHLALLGRRGAATPGAAEVLAALATAGVQARAYACDVADPEALGVVLAEVRAGQPPLAGWVHAAMAVEDGLVRDMDAGRIAVSFGAKLEGALNLDRLTRDDAVEVALLFSSATTALGAPGQGAYVAANMGLEALAAKRQAEGLPTLAVGWGPIADVGFLAREGAALDALERRLSAAPLQAGEALDALPTLWASGRPSLAYAAVHWEAARKRLPALSRPIFSDVATGEAADETDLAERLAGLDPAEAKQVVVELLLDEVAKILSAGADRVDAHRPLAELGMDSLMAVELRMTLESKLKVSLPLMSLSDTATISSLAGRITASVFELQGGAPAKEAAADVVAAGLAHEPVAETQFAAEVRRPEATAAE